MSTVERVFWLTLAFAAASLYEQPSIVYAQFETQAPGRAAPAPGGFSVPPPGGVNAPAVHGLIIAPAPPPGFNPLTASDAALKGLGFPPRPDASKNPTAYAHWNKMMSAAKTHIVPELKSTNIYHGPARNVRPVDRTTGVPQDLAAPSRPAASNGTLTTSTNWSGWVDYQPSAPFLGNNSYVYGQWIIPFAQQAFGTCTGDWEYSSQWVGFDGFNSNDVLQAGSEADAYCNNGNQQQFYSLWIEWYPNPESQISNFPIHPGDLVEVEVWYASGTGNAYLINYTTQQSTTIGFSPPNGTVFQGTSVEWIVEAPTVNGGQSALMNYTATPWNFAFAYSTTTTLNYEPNTAPSGTAYDLLMTSGGNTISYCNLFQPINPQQNALWCYPYGSAL